MTFGADHYVPALKLKLGEKDALAMLSATIKARITPLFQIVEMNGTKSLDEHLETAFKKFHPSVAGVGRYFIDPIEIEAHGAAAAAKVFDMCRYQALPFTPVTGISRPTALTAAAMSASGRTGLAIRLTRKDFESGQVQTALPAFIELQKIDPAATDLIVDAGAVSDMIEEGIAAMAELFLASIPKLSSWKTLTLIASAFPRSMQHVDRDSHALVQRAEWVAWRDHLRRNRTTLARLPTFGDWGIQHPTGVEQFDPIKMQASAAIRYTLDSQWLLIKGRGTKKSSPSVQMPGLARSLVSGPHKKHFLKAQHCAGCELIEKAAQGAPKVGSLTKWRQIGTGHHITTTVEAIQRLPWP